MNQPTRTFPQYEHHDHHWSIVLAGGQGKRLAHFIKQRCGEYRPKQYCAIIGRRSMLRHTIDRIAPLFLPDRVMVTVNAAHLHWAYSDLHERPQHSIIIQPCDRETGAGILLSLLHVHHADPQALVALFPADHFILHEDRYRMFVRRAFDIVAAEPERIVILGVPPTSLQSGYGWIEPDGTGEQEGIRPVRRFWEKPDDQLTRYLHDRGCLWNTMTLVGTSARLLSLMEQYMASIALPCREIVPVLGTRRENEVTDRVFAGLPIVNFSRALLERIPDLLSVLSMEKVYWSDWGDEQRVRADIESLEHRGLPFTGEPAA
ncbi:MAG: NTP transferase domain-containing protein [Bacteroidetes bacterium]|nr:NTP transferase domain-containing protein [Bacteroidota bacterium]